MRQWRIVYYRHGCGGIVTAEHETVLKIGHFREGLVGINLARIKCEKKEPQK